MPRPVEEFLWVAISIEAENDQMRRCGPKGDCLPLRRLDLNLTYEHTVGITAWRRWLGEIESIPVCSEDRTDAAKQVTIECEGLAREELFESLYDRVKLTNESRNLFDGCGFGQDRRPVYTLRNHS
jgi:hypothetical protein